MPKKLDWKQTWLALADAFRRAKMDELTGFMTTPKGTIGICSEATAMNEDGEISYEILQAVFVVADAERVKKFGSAMRYIPYLWTCDDDAGRKARISFCVKMSKTKPPRME